MTETEAPKDFDLLAYARGRSRAKETVELYMDEDAANEASKYLKYNEDGKVIGVTDEDKYRKAAEKLTESVVTVHLQGLDEGRYDDLRAEYEIKDGEETEADDDTFEAWVVAVLVEMYQKTVSSGGGEDTKSRDSSEWFEFKKIAPKSQWYKLLSEVKNLIFVSSVIDESVDAGFSLKS